MPLYLREMFRKITYSLKIGLLSIVKSIMKKESDNIINLFDFKRRLVLDVPVKKLTKIAIIRCD